MNFKNMHLYIQTVQDSTYERSTKNGNARLWRVVLRIAGLDELFAKYRLLIRARSLVFETNEFKISKTLHRRDINIGPQLLPKNAKKSWNRFR